MKVILLEDIYKQGVAGEMVEVAPGYARNYLLPRKLAVKASAGALRQFEGLRKAADTRRVAQHAQNEQLAGQIEQITLGFPVKAGETGKLYGSVTASEIAAALEQELGIPVDRRRVGDRPLRELGSFNVPVRLDGGVTPHVRVIVHREGENPLAQPEAEAEAEPAVAEEAYYAEETGAEEASEA
jgi:large subunit ribosomal protein L9